MSSASTTDSPGDRPESEATMTEKARRFTHDAIDSAAEKAEALERNNVA